MVEDVRYLPDGTSCQFRARASETGGAFTELEFVVPPSEDHPPPHLHPGHEERLTVLDGELDILLEQEWSHLAVGETVTIPAGVSHTLANRGQSAVRFHDRHTPPDEIEAYFDEIVELLRSDSLTPDAMRALQDRYRDTIGPGTEAPEGPHLAGAGS